MRSQDAILEYFRCALNSNVLGTSYLFIGRDYSPVHALAAEIGCSQQPGVCGRCWDCKQIARGSHPDICLIEPEGFTLKIEQIRQCIRFLSLKSYSLVRKIVIIKDAHALSPAAANAFLKTLEEPSQNSFIALCTSHVEDLLPTIVSRCRKIFLPFDQSQDLFTQNTVIEDFMKGKDVRFKNRQDLKVFLWSLATLLHAYIRCVASGQNNELPNFGGCEIILNRYGLLKTQALLERVLQVYGDAKTINMNLALQLIRVCL